MAATHADFSAPTAFLRASRSSWSNLTFTLTRRLPLSLTPPPGTCSAPSPTPLFRGTAEGHPPTPPPASAPPSPLSTLPSSWRPASCLTPPPASRCSFQRSAKPIKNKNTTTQPRSPSVPCGPFLTANARAGAHRRAGSGAGGGPRDGSR